ncbi:MAG TPA: hypothetical protein VHB79_16465 [Polyangiaceae bacterium]|nr:hypothetical protein [Polyangiaceae bacterium]
MSDESKALEAEAESKPEAEAEAESSTTTADEPKTSVQGEPAADTSKTATAAEEDDAALDARGRERPRFLLSFPTDPDLARLSAAFEAGNYALVRAEAEALAERTENPAVRDAALELRRRIDPDPLAKYLLALTAALLLSLAYFAYHH